MRVLLVLPTESYRTAPFLRAADVLGAEVVVASDRASSLSALMGDRMLTVDLGRPAHAGERARGALEGRHVDAVVGVDETAVLTAAHLAAALGVTRHHRVEAVAATRDKRLLRRALGVAGVPQPRWIELGSDELEVAERIAAGPGFPAVLKPVDLAASRGVIRVDSAAQAVAAQARIGRLLGGDAACGPGPWPLLAEAFIPGLELAIEGVVVDGRLQVLAVFDKPDPLDGPFFEETLYVSPTRVDAATRQAVEQLVGDAVTALGLGHGPVHAEVRLGPNGPVVIEVAARSIGGRCSQVMRFGDEGRTLEELILRLALGLELGSTRLTAAAGGVMMLPIPAAGRVRSVEGVERARRVDGIDEVSIGARAGDLLVPLPEGGRYLGFVFATGDDAGAVERSLRAAAALIDVRLEPVPV